MIAFQCPRCHKPLIMPNRKAGAIEPCPGCLEQVQVPEARPVAPPSVLQKLMPFIVIAAAVTAFIGWRSYQAREPMRIRERFAAALTTQSPQWQGIGWEKCDSSVGDYKLSVLYVGSRKSYNFAATCFAPIRQTFVFVDPSAQQTQFLAHLIFTNGEMESFRYTGGDPDEREELQLLTLDLARTLSHVTR
jgi:hypothetical protein